MYSRLASALCHSANWPETLRVEKRIPLYYLKRVTRKRASLSEQSQGIWFGCFAFSYIELQAAAIERKGLDEALTFLRPGDNIQHEACAMHFYSSLILPVCTKKRTNSRRLRSRSAISSSVD